MAAPTKVWAKVKKLLRLANSPEIHEAARAAEEAQRIMRKHNLTAADFEDDVVEVADDERDVHRQKLAYAVGASRRCVSIVNKRGQVAFRGKPAPARDAKETYQKIVAAVKANCETKDPGQDLWRLCYWLGFVDAVVGRLIDDEARSWVPEPDPEPTKAVEHAKEKPIMSPTDDVPSIEEESAKAIKDFTGNFLDSDKENALKHFCERAYGAGSTLGRNLPIEAVRREKKHLALQEAQPEAPGEVS